jgi:BirA family biotin operon repressor/biotin-[acetyl-CoA-carboxylase] ligase
MNKIFYKIIDSTILEAFRIIDSGFVMRDNLLLLAAEQTNGISSKDGVEWFSPYGNLYFTLILSKKQYSHFSQHWFTFIASVCVVEYLKSFLNNVDIKIKWPNDVLLDDKKVCGVLAQSYKNYFVISIGLNLLSHPSKTLNFPATSVFNFCNDYDKCNYLDFHFTSEYLYNLFFNYLQNDDINFNLIRGKWLSYAYKFNDKVMFINSNELLKFIEINDDGFMLCEKQNGELIEVFHGEIAFN